ncbi:PDC sensor domain-containing protein [Nocardia beijingensis]|uniref:cache domain-containing protein n=1 Tax=Nocardia beijingensis TaxID=95162 RepID=UPI001894BD52|nr:cache domain-containing protein [Nocardia beijingensis]MBF6470029.1 PDC sensor domain-containing protein [Nocardia beijingensis]
MRDTDSFSTPVNVESLADAVTELADEIYQSLGTIGAGLAALWDGLTEKPRHTPRSTDLAPLRDTIVAELERRGKLFEGAGLVMADAVLADRPRYLEWWSIDPDRGPQRLVLELNPENEYFYDYTAMEWFEIPRDQARRWVHGPRLDYACTDQYVCTFAIPVTAGSGAFLGIAGADVPVASIEDLLLPRFRAFDERVLLVNNEGRVIMGTDPEFTTGSKTSRMNPPTAAVPIQAVPWSLQLL